MDSSHAVGTDPKSASQGPLLRIVRKQKVAFVLVGGINTALGLSTFALLYQVWGHVLGYMGALAVAYAFAILVAFYLHRRFVFRVTGQVLKDLTRFIGVNLTSLFINAALLPMAVEVVGLPAIPAQVAVTMIVVVLTYFGHLTFSFGRPHTGPGYPAEPGDDRQL